MTRAAHPLTRRTLLGGLAAGAASALPSSVHARETTMTETDTFWPNGARLAVSVSLMFEGGGHWMRNSPRTLDILQELGFRYHIDEPSRDEPFLVTLKGGDFVTVPYTLHMNDIVSFPFQGWNPAAYEAALRDEFDQLYEEGAHRRRMMVVSLHDRISGHANRVRALDRFLAYARSKPGVWFARKDAIADWALQARAGTPVYARGAPTVSGLPGSAD